MNRLFIKVLSICYISLVIASTVFSVVFAEGNIYIKDYKKDINLHKDETYTFVLKADNAVGKVHVYSEKDNISSINSDYVWINMNELAITITAKNQGKSVVHIEAIDCASYDEEILNFDYLINVKVADKERENSNQNSGDTQITPDNFISDRNNKDKIEKEVEEYNVNSGVNDIDVLTPEEEEVYENTVIIEKTDTDFSLLGINRKILICIVMAIVCTLLISVLLIIKYKSKGEGK